MTSGKGPKSRWVTAGLEESPPQPSTGVPELEPSAAEREVGKLGALPVLEWRV